MEFTRDVERRDWDLWDATIKFRDPDWVLSTPALWRTIGIDDKAVDFKISGDEFGGFLAGEEQAVSIICSFYSLLTSVVSGGMLSSIKSRDSQKRRMD
jgi:hypothetical protein